jgi:hypothetical protein
VLTTHWDSGKASKTTNDQSVKTEVATKSSQACIDFTDRQNEYSMKRSLEH